MAEKRAKRKKPAKKARSAKAARAAKRPQARRADYGAPVDAFFARQSGELRAVLDALRKMIEAAAPGVGSSIKWGMPFFSVNGEMMCALGGHQSHVNLILPGPPGTYADPDGLLEGTGKTGRHLKLTTLADLPRAVVKSWLKVAAQRARAG